MKNNFYSIESDFSKQIIIDWYPTLKCNYRCSYCFVNLDNKLDFEYKKFERFKNILNKSKNNIYLRILGGEPTLISNFYVYLNELNTNINIELVTNGSNDISHYEINSIEYSIHLEYFNKNKFQFFQNLLNSKAKKNTVIINIHHSFTEEILKKIKNIITEIKELIYKNNLNTKFNINPIVNNINDKTLDYDFYIKFFEIENLLEQEHQLNYKLINLKTKETKLISFFDHIEIYKKRNNNFKGSYCYNNYFKIDYNYNIYYNCQPNILYNILEKEKLPEIKPIICPNTYCDDGCFLDCKKKFKVKG